VPPLYRARTIPPRADQARQKQGKNLGFTLRIVLLAQPSEGKILSIGCPDLATVVHIWPALSIFGQFWPSLANLVHVALSYTHRVVLRGRRRALKSENSLRKAREQPSRGLKHCRAGRVAVRDCCPGRSGSRHETHAQQASSAQPPARTPICASRRRA
jgi:hypothetical protein